MPNAEPSEPVARTATGTVASAGKARLWFIASLPPPVDGQSNCNSAMLGHLSERAALVPLSVGRTVTAKIVRGFSNGWMLLRHARADDVAYFSVPGQLGAWMLLPAIVALRLRGVEAWFHHHSFRSINRGPLKVMRALVACAGSRQNHILLSDVMRDRFAAMYLSSPQRRAYTLSNTCLFPPDTQIRPVARPERPCTLGHLSVLTRAKGVFYLIDLFDTLVAQVPGIRLILAGPVCDQELAHAITAAAARHPDAFEYRGMIGGKEKADFYRDIDLFVLPTTLVDEAEPLVMIEAYAQGVDVFASATGCIPDRLRDPACTLTLDRTKDAAMISSAATAMPTGWMALRNACHTHVVQLAATNAFQGHLLLTEICAKQSSSLMMSAMKMATR
ncbi:glycosyltransferase family 4 protein [Sphingomonas sp. Leaf339]|uniref:glycosyltransferase family 4 protein n=1 Tax=Sphingomonas sp. Leaf339 TaxID=1736343 RepID=UPI0012E3C3F5|nr:glycosyltransferase family 4 protein [Sphingomonas sp. Leaf339]